MKKVKRFCALTIGGLLLMGGLSCSYVMDSVEGAITKRSSFSVDVKVDGTNITFDWSKDAPSIDAEAFAGYEIYVSDTANDEFAGYSVLRAGYDINAIVPGTDGDLLSTTTNSVQVSLAAIPIDYRTPGNTYFFRVGIIYWDEETQEDRDENWTNPVWSGNEEYYYKTGSSIEEVSGGAMVEF